MARCVANAATLFLKMAAPIVTLRSWFALAVVAPVGLNGHGIVQGDTFAIADNSSRDKAFPYRMTF